MNAQTKTEFSIEIGKGSRKYQIKQTYDDKSNMKMLSRCRFLSYLVEKFNN
jgi:hypothetical protein